MRGSASRRRLLRLLGLSAAGLALPPSAVGRLPVTRWQGVALGAQSSTTHSNYAEEKLPSADLRLYPTPDEYKLDVASGRLSTPEAPRGCRLPPNHLHLITKQMCSMVTTPENSL